MKNADGKVIYVGKSKKLKNRVTSYFTGTGHSVKTARMVAGVRDFDYIVCATEIEALTLENVLIKKHSPRYNIKLKDAKSYPYIKVTAEEYPKLFVTRERRSDRGRYFGPYQSSESAHTALETVMKIFSLPTCKRSFPRDIGKERPCIYRDMCRCIAPCTGDVSPEEYASLVKGAEGILSGNSRDTKASLRAEMEMASESLEFERAAALRDSIAALDRLSERQKVVADAKVNRDVFAIHVSETEGALAVLTVRDGALINKQEFILSAEDAASSDDVISLIADYYDGTGNVPREIMLDFPLSDEDATLLSEYLSIDKRFKVAVRFPERGEGRALCDMAAENAAEASRQYRLEGEREDKSLRRLCELLGIRELPRRIEAYDISNIGNESITASMIVYKDGALKKSDYRIFGIKSTEGADDYASMREALTRRLAHIGDGSASLGERPDMLLIDGGVGHVSVARKVAAEYDLDVHIYGMVKDDFHKTRALTDGDAEIAIAREMNVYAFIFKLQEEAHRFAVKSSQGAKTRTLTHSSLEKIRGIGQKKAKLLLSKMSLSEIRVASEESLAAIKGISATDAHEIYEYFEEKKRKALPVLRIITGTAKGKKLKTLEGEATRPTSERIKEAIFSSLQFDIEGRRVLDLFAGSGQMGLEALSRGAESVMFVDSSREAMDIVKDNARTVGFERQAKYTVSDWRNFIRKASGRGERYDLVFVDPPYADECCADAASRLAAGGMLPLGAIVVLESGTEEISIESLVGFELIKSRDYGKKTALHILIYRGGREE